MKTIFRRLKSTRGESLIESMAAILIFTFASILFLSMVNAAADVNLSVREADDAFQAQQQAVESVPAATPTANAKAVLYPKMADGGEPNESDKLATVNMALVTTEGEDALYTWEVAG